MENFNVHLSLLADECIFDDKKIKFSQKLPRPLSLDNYEVALTEFTSTALNDPEGNLCIKRFIGDYVDFTEMNKTIFVPINLEIESEAIINENIKNHLAVYLYYFYQHLFYNPDEIIARGIAKNQILFINNQNETVVAFSPDFYNKYLSWFTNFNSNVVKISNKDADALENIIIKHNHEKGEANFSKTAEYVTITRFKTFESKNPEIYKIKFHALTGEHFNKILAEFNKSNHPDTYKAESIKISKRIQDNQIYFKLNTSNDNVGIVYWGNKFYFLSPSVEVKIDPIYKNDSIIIESDLIPYQYMDKKFKRILKVISFGKFSFNLTNNESKYFRVIKPYLTSINISISFLNNPYYLKNLLKDQINITLNFRKK